MGGKVSSRGRFATPAGHTDAPRCASVKEHFLSPKPVHRCTLALSPSPPSSPRADISLTWAIEFASEAGGSAYATLGVCWDFDLGKPQPNETVTELSAMANVPRASVSLTSESRVPMGDYDLNRWRLCHRVVAVPDPPAFALKLSQVRRTSDTLRPNSDTLLGKPDCNPGCNPHRRSRGSRCWAEGPPRWRRSR